MQYEKNLFLTGWKVKSTWWKVTTQRHKGTEGEIFRFFD